jgi:hypothetical protein
MTDGEMYHRFIDQLLFVKDDLTTEEQANLIEDKKNKKNGYINGLMMKLKFDEEYNLAKMSKNEAISDNTLLTFIHAEYKMYALGKKTLEDDTLENFSSTFLKNGVKFWTQKITESAEKGDEAKVKSSRKSRGIVHQRYIVELRQIKLSLARECLDLTSAKGIALYNRFERESKIITTAQRYNVFEEHYQWIDDLLDEAVEGFNI